jgi:CubicO group peptidase (beta-lactamase class C family)
MSSSGLSLRARDWAKIGQLVLNHGVWEAKQIVPASWIAQSTTEQIKARKPFSYGFQWWLGRSLNEGRVVECGRPRWASMPKRPFIIPELDVIVVFNASRESVRMVAPEIALLDIYVSPAILQH